SATSRFVCIWIMCQSPDLQGHPCGFEMAGQASAGAATTLQRLLFEIGAHSSMRTLSPTLWTFSGSCAWYFFDRRTVFLSTGCVKRRSTSTVTVCSFLSLVTVPVRTRLGISGLLRRGGGLRVQDRL